MEFLFSDLDSTGNLHKCLKECFFIFIQAEKSSTLKFFAIKFSLKFRNVFIRTMVSQKRIKMILFCQFTFFHLFMVLCKNGSCIYVKIYLSSYNLSSKKNLDFFKNINFSQIYMKNEDLKEIIKFQIFKFCCTEYLFNWMLRI